MNKCVVFVTVFLLAIIGFSKLGLSAEPFHVVVSGPYPPFAEIAEDGSIRGFDKDIAEAICRELGRECLISNMEFDEIIPALVEGRIDFAVAGMGTNEERVKKIDFTGRYYRSVSIFVGHQGTFADITPESVKGKRIAAQTATLQAAYLESSFGDTVTLVTDSSYEALFGMLKRKEVDLVFSDGLPGYAYLMSEQGEELESIGAPIEPEDESNWGRIALAKNRAELREAINQAIQTIRRTGEYDKINRKYFDFTIY